MLVSSTEPATFRHLGTASTLPEKYGVDFLWRHGDGWHGVQRKTVADLLASIRDGRMGKEKAQWGVMRSVAVVVEGDYAVIGDRLYPSGSRAEYGVDVVQWWAVQHDLNTVAEMYRTRNRKETRHLVELLYEWTGPGHQHQSLRHTREPVPVNNWGKSGSREYSIHLLTGLPGVGPELAARIIDTLGVPFMWRPEVQGRLGEVEGIGPKKAAQILRALD